MMAGDRHCGQCGTNVAAPAKFVHRDGAVTLPCPRCSTALTANLVGKQIFDRCDRCGGMWAHHLAIDAVLEHKPARSSVRQWLTTLPAPRSRGSDNDPALPCPDCEVSMQEYQLPRNKRVTIEVCGEHGIWFDHHEIRTLVGGKARRKRRRHMRARPVKNRSSFAGFLRDTDDWWPWEALEELLEFLEDLFD
ncbi:MAG: zf-TFIIB domain-containing protein [Gammaproteobacteria bacterium]|nr:zf-TFIIB domain-containing protein [Gammaproteobacteria bacterium]